MRNRWVLILAGFFVLTGCNQGDKFSKHSSGLEYRFIESNTTGQSPEKGDIIVVSIKYYSPDGQLIDGSDRYRLQVNVPGYAGDFYTGLQMLQVGDSVCFKLDGADFYEKTRKDVLPRQVQQGDDILVFLRLKSIISAGTLEQERRSMYHTDQTQEMSLLEGFLERSNVEEEPLESGLYVIIKDPGTGQKAVPGNTLVVHYTGKTIDGRLFDTSLDKPAPFSFTLGRGEVIPGWEEGFTYLNKGAKARFIIPSDLAYGSTGFRDVILPYSTLIFDVELIDIK